MVCVAAVSFLSLVSCKIVLDNRANLLYNNKAYADMAELADAPDLGSGVPDVQVQILLSAIRRNSSMARVLYLPAFQ